MILMIAAKSAIAQVSAVSSIKLERTECYGTCPIYSITIFSDGRVRYEGKNFVKVKGVRIDKISEDGFHKLAVKAEQIRFFGFDTDYSGIKIGDGFTTSTDLPTAIVTVTRGSETKKVKDYMGAPKRLYEFEKQIERTAKPWRWVGNRSLDDLNTDVPYYEHFPLNRRIAFRGLLRREWTGPLESLHVSGYALDLPKNALSFTVHAATSLDLGRFCGDLADATGVLESSDTFRLDSIRVVRHVFDHKKPWP